MKQPHLPLFDFWNEPASSGNTKSPTRPSNLEDELATFDEFGKKTVRLETPLDGGGVTVPTFVNEFWTAKQRAARRLHEISYRACFKPQVPRFFIERLTKPGDVVYDPFMGRGTTCLEAALLGRVPVGCDINPLSRILLEPRLSPPQLVEIAQRLKEIVFDVDDEFPEELLAFYHPKTLRAICGLRKYFRERQQAGELDQVDRWIRMVAINRLTGHSAGFFSVYSLPPNQAVSVKSQLKINAKRAQIPPERDVPVLILRKSRNLLSDFDQRMQEVLRSVYPARRLITASATATGELASNSVALAVTSPPFLDVVDYAGDNWLRLWFCEINQEELEITVLKKLNQWEETMAAVFKELARVLRPGGHVAFEVGEVRGGKVKLEEAVVRSAVLGGLSPRLILINDQKFTKTANCWGVENGKKGTNTNRVVLLRRE